MIIARFSAARLTLFFGGALFAAIIAGVIIAMGWIGDSTRGPGVVAAAVVLVLVAVRTGWSLLRWKGPAVEVTDAGLRAWGLSRPVPLGDIADVQLAASETDIENWIGVIVYRHAGPRARVPTFFLDKDRRRVALALREAVGLPDAGLHR
ncbi:MAG: hypothetical protein ACT6TH_04410 [Brevundimonas sp.]|uniref:hypothetical protein n=1 Tax=Brevundimonas sp. TaxID=1871086 RepID=UPI0040346637